MDKTNILNLKQLCKTGLITSRVSTSKNFLPFDSCKVRSMIGLTVHSLCTHCALTVHSLYYYCTANAQSVHSQCTVNAQSIWP